MSKRLAALSALGIVVLVACADDPVAIAPGQPLQPPVVIPPVLSDPGTELWSDDLHVLHPDAFIDETSAEDEAVGIYRFRVVGGADSGIEAYDFIYGQRDDTGYLRRVMRVEESQGAVAFHTTDGFWHEVVNPGTYTERSLIPGFGADSNQVAAAFQALQASTATGGASAVPVPLPSIPPINFDNTDLCNPTLCPMDGSGLTKLHVDSGSVQITGTLDFDHALTAGGQIVPGTGRAPTFYPCNVVPNAFGCLGYAGNVLRSFLLSIGLNPNLPATPRVCIPGTIIIVKAGSWFSLPVTEICRITDYGQLPTFTLPGLDRFGVVISHRLQGKLVLSLAGKGKIPPIHIPIPSAGYKARVPLAKGSPFHAYLTAGAFIQIDAEAVGSARVRAVMDESSTAGLTWSSTSGWASNLDIPTPDVQASLDIQSVDSVTVKAALQAELTVGICLGIKGNLCSDPSDSTKTKTKKDLQIGASGKAILARFVEARWFRDQVFDNWHMDVDGAFSFEAGAELYFQVGFLQDPISPLKKGFGPYEFGRVDMMDLHGRGLLELTTVTTGADPDPDGYSLGVARADTLPWLLRPTRPGAPSSVAPTRVGPPSWKDTLSTHLGANATHTFTPSSLFTPAGKPLPCFVLYSDISSAVSPGIIGLQAPLARRLGLSSPNFGRALGCDLLVADYEVTLSGVADNCQVVGGNPHSVRLQQEKRLANRSNVKQDTIRVHCTAASGSLGAMDVSTTTSGQSLDPDGYRVLVDGVDRGPVGINDAVSVTALQAMADRSVQLGGVAPNCSVAGANPRLVTIVAGATSMVSFDVSCMPTQPVAPGSIDVTTSTTGKNLDPDGYGLTFGGTTSTIGVNGRTNLTNLSPGVGSLQLTGLASNCAVNGANPAVVTVPAGASIPVNFSVTCASIGTPTTGVVEVIVQTGGDDVDPDGYLVSVGGSDYPVSANGAIEVGGLLPGDLTIKLGDVAPNCVWEGENPRTVEIVAGEATAARFALTCEALGALELSVLTTGDEVGSDGYRVLVNDIERGVIGTTGALLATDLVATTHSVALDGLAPNCAVQGEHPRLFDVQPGETQAVELTVLCVPASSLTDVEVSVFTVGPGVDPDGYQVLLDGALMGPIAIDGALPLLNVFPGNHRVELTGIAVQCSAAGGVSRDVTTAGGQDSVRFEVTCTTSSGGVVDPSK